MNTNYDYYYVSACSAHGDFTGSREDTLEDARKAFDYFKGHSASVELQGYMEGNKNETVIDYWC